MKDALTGEIRLQGLPGWTATVNGKPAPLQMTNGAFRGLWLERGTNQISMRYWPPFFALWASISTASLLLAIVGVFFGRAVEFNR